MALHLTKFWEKSLNSELRNNSTRSKDRQLICSPKLSIQSICHRKPLKTAHGVIYVNYIQLSSWRNSRPSPKSFHISNGFEQSNIGSHCDHNLAGISSMFQNFRDICQLEVVCLSNFGDDFSCKYLPTYLPTYSMD